MATEYERLRENNIAANRKVLAELGLLAPYTENVSLKVKVPSKRFRSKKPASSPRITTLKANDSDENVAPVNFKARRRSGRLLGKTPEQSTIILEEEEEDLINDDDDAKQDVAKVQFARFSQNTFGAISGIPVGTLFLTRLEASHAGLHRPTVAGIHGNEREGCYSLALSGGYEDDVDLGDCFTYTGEGGRDLKGTKANPKNLRTAPQSKDQTLTRGNLALTKNIEFKTPVRVLRGYKLNSPFAPEEGYRYDGLYSVKKFWQAKGKSGFLVYKFALKRCEGQELPPWNMDKFNESQASSSLGETTDDQLMHCSALSSTSLV